MKKEKSDIERMRDWFQMKIKASNITVYKISKGSNGYAYFESRKIKVPEIIDIDTFGVCMHEIGHIINGNIKPNYLSEYKAEQYAINSIKFLKLDHTKYEKRAKGYVLMNLAKATWRKLNIDNVPKEIKDWCGIDFNEWKNNKMYVSNWTTQIKIEVVEPQSIKRWIKAS